MSLRASGAALGDHFVIYQADPELVNALVLGNSIILTGTLAARPAASIAGRLYFATDNGSLYRDSGSAWATYSAIGFLSGAGAIPFAANPATAGYLSLPIGVNKTVLRSDGTAPTWSTKVILTDPDISQGIIPPSDAIALFLRAFSDTQVSGIFFVQNAAGSKTWVKVTPDGLTTIAQLLVQPGSDLFSLVLRPFSDTQSSGILFIQSAGGGTTYFAVLPTGKVTVGVGVTPDGGGVKHARVAFANMPAGTSLSPFFSWGTPFADANYTVNVSVQSTGEHSIIISAKSASSVTVDLINHGVANDGGGTIHAIAMHD